MSRQIGVKRQQYSPQLLEKAAEIVRSKTVSLNRAAKQFGVPKTTLHNAVHYKYSSHKVGHQTVLSSEEENRVAEWATHMARIGYGRTRQELASTVKKILVEDGRPNPFKDNRPGKEWLTRFFARHPDLSLRTSIQLGKERAIVSSEKINQWFKNFKSYIENEVGDADLLKDPARIYNADETGVSLSMKGSQVIGVKGAPVVYHYGNSDKTQITVMAACSAVGHYIPPMLIFPGQRFSYNPLEGFEEAALGRSDNGWMDAEVYANWLENVFIPAINDRKVKKPVLLLIDGHVTHVTMRASDICLQNGIEMYCLLEHASHVLQPLDLRLFSALKKSWRQCVRDWQADHIGEYVTKQNFAQIFKKAWTQSTTIEAAVKGFQEAGLFPLEPSVVASSVKLEPSKMFLSTCMSVESKSPKCLGTDENEQLENDSKSSENNSMVPVSTTDPAPASDNEGGSPIESFSQDKENQEKPTNNTASPFSKHLTIPLPKPSTSTKPKVVRKLVIPKAITGTEYRKLMEEKRKRKEEEEKEKERRKTERELKRKLKEEESNRKKTEAEAKRHKRAEEKQKKRVLREKLLQALENSDSESDSALEVDRQKCYKCESAYTTDFIECANCFRRFHIHCVEDDYLNVDVLPFECNYC